MSTVSIVRSNRMFRVQTMSRSKWWWWLLPMIGILIAISRPCWTALVVSVAVSSIIIPAHTSRRWLRSIDACVYRFHRMRFAIRLDENKAFAIKLINLLISLRRRYANITIHDRINFSSMECGCEVISSKQWKYQELGRRDCACRLRCHGQLI